MLMTDGLMVETWRNMVKSMVGILEDPAALFAMFFYQWLASAWP